MRTVFEKIYNEKTWYYGESISGPGSTMVQTESVRAELPGLIRELGVRSLLDAGCGDLNWMKELEAPLERYLGVDVVPGLVEQNRRRFAAPNRDFKVADIVLDRLPRVDLVLCRDCLTHFSYQDIFAALRNLRQSGSTYLLTTTFPGRPENADVATGSWRTLNYARAPFAFPAPLRLINERLTVDEGAYADKSLGLWRFRDLPLGPLAPVRS